MEICKFNQEGFCKFGGRCSKTHENEICASRNECINPECNKRHPRKCRYFLKFGYCKFGDNCAYSHMVDKNAKVDQLEKEMEKLKHEKNEKVAKVEKQEKEISELKEEVNNVKQLMKEEVSVLKDELKTVKEMMSKMYRLFKSNKEKENENENESVTESCESRKAGQETFKCEQCEYETKKRITLKKHMNTKHGKSSCNEEKKKKESSENKEKSNEKSAAKDCETCESCENCNFIANGENCDMCRTLMYAWAAEQCGLNDWTD